MDIGRENEIWADRLIASFIDQKINYFCIAPGSRSTPLVLAIIKNERTQSMIHFDERGVGFHALGYAKASGRPAVIVVTSGSAVVNLFPALMEAAQSHVPLIVLTADRPPELRDCGANQSTDQIKIFGNFVRWFIDLPCPTDSLSENYLTSTISQAVLLSTSVPKGPVHINCMFREPLFSGEFVATSPLSTPHCYPIELRAKEEAFIDFGQKLSKWKKGIILLGACSSPYKKIALSQLAQKIGWPIFPDILSNLRGETSSSGTICNYYDLILKSLPEVQADALLYFGEHLVSKTLQIWTQKIKPKKIFRVSDHLERINSLHQVTDRLFSSIDLFCETVMPHVALQDDSWINQWMEYGRVATEVVDANLVDKQLSEPGLIQILKNNVTEDRALFFANSMPIRDADLFFFPKTHVGPIFGSRGISGIDGNIATAVGICQGLQKPTIAVIGDLAFLHDMNSLALLKDAPFPLTLIVVNNGGGGIFSFLPISKKTLHFEKYFATAHSYSFAKIAQQFDLDYFSPKNVNELEGLLSKNHLSGLIEITTNRMDNVARHQKIYDQVNIALNNLVSV